VLFGQLATYHPVVVQRNLPEMILKLIEMVRYNIDALFCSYLYLSLYSTVPTRSSYFCKTVELFNYSVYLLSSSMCGVEMMSHSFPKKIDRGSISKELLVLARARGWSDLLSRTICTLHVYTFLPSARAVNPPS